MFYDIGLHNNAMPYAFRTYLCVQLFYTQLPRCILSLWDIADMMDTNPGI